MGHRTLLQTNFPKHCSNQLNTKKIYKLSIYKGLIAIAENCIYLSSVLKLPESLLVSK